MMPARHLRARGPVGRTSGNMAGSSSETVIPFDHAASFELKGVPGNIVQDVINISTEGSFVAVGIGYGFEEDRTRPASVEIPEAEGTFKPNSLLLNQIPTDALIEGFRLNPRGDRLIFNEQPQIVGGRPVLPKDRTFSETVINRLFAESIVERVKPVQEISFLFSIVDSSTGRELQDEPIHNLASLGKSNGERPFRMLAQPLIFQPRSTVRLQIVERSEGIRGTLFIVLYGYKVLGSASGVETSALRVSTSRSQFGGGPQPRVIPFDYVSSFQLTGVRGNHIDEEIPINAEGGFVATAIGYGLGVETLDVTLKENKLNITTTPPPNKTKFINLSEVKLEAFPSNVLEEGIRIRPNFLRVVLNGSRLSGASVRLDLANKAFERLNRPEDVAFRYSIFDGGTGRELQNQPINNIAGLGIANGDRPFKQLVRPMLFRPRSTIRLTVEERFGRGTLFIVFQGYKLLDSGTSQRSTSARRIRR